MKESKIIRNWDNIKQRIKQNHENLTEIDVTYTEGKEEALFDNLQKKIGISRKELIYLLYLYISETDWNSLKHSDYISNASGGEESK